MKNPVKYLIFSPNKINLSSVVYFHRISSAMHTEKQVAIIFGPLQMFFPFYLEKKTRIQKKIWATPKTWLTPKTSYRLQNLNIMEKA